MTTTKTKTAKPAAAAKPAVKKTRVSKPGTPFEVDGAKAFIAEGAPHQRRTAARDLAAKLNAYADAIVT